MAETADGKWAASTTGREMPRQNGKGDEVEVVELWGLVHRAEAILHTIHDAVVLASERSPFAPLTFGEVLATSDLPAGAANLLVGSVAELAPWLADHHDVDAIEISGVTDAALARDLIVRSADNLKRVARTDGARTPRTAGEFLGNFSFDIVASGEADSYGTLAKLLISNADGTYKGNWQIQAGDKVIEGGKIYLAIQVGEQVVACIL